MSPLLQNNGDKTKQSYTIVTSYRDFHCLTRKKKKKLMSGLKPGINENEQTVSYNSIDVLCSCLIHSPLSDVTNTIESTEIP